MFRWSRKRQRPEGVDDAPLSWRSSIHRNVNTRRHGFHWKNATIQQQLRSADRWSDSRRLRTTPLCSVLRPYDLLGVFASVRQRPRRSSTQPLGTPFPLYCPLDLPEQAIEQLEPRPPPTPRVSNPCDAVAIDFSARLHRFRQSARRSRIQTVSRINTSQGRTGASPLATRGIAISCSCGPNPGTQARGKCHQSVRAFSAVR